MRIELNLSAVRKKIAGHINTMIFIVFNCILTFIVYRYNSLSYATQMTDTAGYIDLIRSVAFGNGLVSPVFSSFYSVLNLLSASADTYCSADLVSLYSNTSFFDWHPYLIAYILAIPVQWKLLDAVEVSAIINATNLVGGCAFLYFYLRKSKLPYWVSILFLASVITFQPWLGNLNGQPYFDRLFYFPGLALVVLLFGSWENIRARNVAVIVAFIFSILISERTAIMATLIVFVYWAGVSKFKLKSKNSTWLVLSTIGVLYVFIYMTQYQNSAFYATQSIASIIHNVKSSIFPGGVYNLKTLTWILIVLPFLLLSQVSNLSIALLSIASLLPNLLITVGGAEKTGFATHYHSGYLPILLGCAAIGMVNFYNIISKKFSIHIASILATIYLLLTLLYNVILVISDGGQLFRARSMNEVDAYISATYLPLIPNSQQQIGIKLRADTFRDFLANVPLSATVSSPEEMMPTLTLSGIRHIDYFPVGMGVSDYIIASYSDTHQKLNVPSYLDEITKNSVSSCLKSKLEQNYFKVGDINLPGISYVLYKKR